MSEEAKEIIKGDNGDDLAKITRSLLFSDPYYGLFLMGLNKYFKKNGIPTAAVGKEGLGECLLIGEDFWWGLADNVKKGILKHELNGWLSIL